MLRSRSRHFLLVAAVFSLALILRLLHLNKTFDLDEMATAAWAMARSPGEVLAQLHYPIEGNAAGYPLFIWAWARLGLSELWLRLPSVIAGALTVAVFYRRNARRFAPEAALWAALLLTVAWFPLLESQNARGYAFYALLAYLALDLWEREKPWAFAIVGWLAVSTHHFAFLYLAPLWAVSLWRVLRRERSARALLPIAVTLLLYIPEIPLLVFQLRNGPGWIPSFTFSRFGAAFVSLAWLNGKAATALLLIPFLAGAISAWRALRFELAWAFFPLLAAAVLSVLVRPVFVEQYFFPTALGLLGVVAGGWDAYLGRAQNRFSIGRTLALATFLCALTGLPSFYAAPKTADWRGAADFIKGHECGKLVVTDPYWVNRWPFYLGAAYEMRHWNEGYPKEPFWLAGAGQPPLPSSERAIGEKLGSPKWAGTNALVYCIRPER